MAKDIVQIQFKPLQHEKRISIFYSFYSHYLTFCASETPEKINYGNRIDKGVVLLTGGISFNKDVDKSTSFDIQVGPQFAVSKHFSLNLGFEYQTEKTLNYIVLSGKDEYTTTTFSIIPGCTVFGNVSFGWLQPYVEIGIPIGFLSDSQDNHATGVGAGLNPGLNIYLSRKIAFSASIGLLQYSQVKYKDTEEKDNTVRLGLTPNDIQLGLIWILGGN